MTLAVTADALREPAEDAVAAGVAGGDSIREGLRRAWEWLQRPV